MPGSPFNTGQKILQLAADIKSPPERRGSGEGAREDRGEEAGMSDGGGVLFCCLPGHHQGGDKAEWGPSTASGSCRSLPVPASLWTLQFSTPVKPDRKHPL